jgi:transposase InsO family protein
LLKSGFVAETPDEVWVSDITYVRANGKWNYLTKIMDLYSRKVVGYSFSTTLNTSDTVVAAFRFAVKHSGKAPLIFHSDRGSQYSSVEFRKELDKFKVLQSMTSDGHCFDNAYAESFFKTICLKNGCNSNFSNVKLNTIIIRRRKTWEFQKNK